MAAKPYAAMQNLLRDQAAAAQAMREAATDISYAAEMMAAQFKDGSGPSGHGYGGANGGRPRMNGNGIHRPDHGASNGYGKGINGVRSMMADQLHGRFGANSGNQYREAFDRKGNHVGYHEYNQDGSYNGLRKMADPGLAEDLAAAGSRGMKSKIISGFSSGGLASGMKAVPYVGAAVMGAEAIHEGFVKFGQERQKNSQYQGIYGGSNLGTGFHNRRLEEGFKLSQMFSGGLTGADATAAFRGVSGLGIAGDQRSNDLNFISANYKSMGMGVSESLQLISTAAKNLNMNLVGLKDGLKSVSDVAKATGQNAGMSRQLFSSNYGAISATNPGVGSAGISGALTNMQTGMGRAMQGLDFTSQFTTQGGLAQLAPLTGGLNGNGMTMSQLRGAAMTGSDQILQASDTMMAQIAAPFLTAEVKAVIDQAVNQVPGGMDTIRSNPDMIMQLITPKVLQVVNADEIKAAYGRIQSLQNITPDQAVTLMIQQYKGLAGNLKAQRDKMLDSKKQDLSKMPKTTGGAGGGTYGRGGGAFNAHKSNIKGVNPVVDDARSALKGKNVIVNSAGGQRVVSIDEAAKDYTDQIAKGTAIVAETGQSVKDSLGGEFENNYSGTDTSAHVASKGQTDKKSGLNSDRGMSVDAFNASQAKKNGKSGGTVIIQPSQQLLQLLSFSATGNVAIATGGAASGSVPVPGS
jgi:hypothetical protein